MANLDKIKTICECQYMLSNKEILETRDNFNDVPNMHEIDEEESECEETEIIEQPSLTAYQDDKITSDNKDDDKATITYTDESFCSDESGDDSEVTSRITLGSLKSLSLLHVDDFQHSPKKEIQNTEINKEKDDFQDESCMLNSDGLAHTTPTNEFAKSRRCRRWNMSFTDEEMRKIGRENELLLRKIMAQQRPRHKIIDERITHPRLSSSAINRKKLQKKIEDDNMV